MADAESHVVMLVQGRQGEDSQWFDYKPSYFGDTVRIEWDKGTNFVALPASAANYLLSHGYARKMTDAEMEAYTAPVDSNPPTPVPAADPPAKPKKEKAQ